MPALYVCYKVSRHDTRYYGAISSLFWHVGNIDSESFENRCICLTGLQGVVFKAIRRLIWRQKVVRVSAVVYATIASQRQKWQNKTISTIFMCIINSDQNAKVCNKTVIECVLRCTYLLFFFAERCTCTNVQNSSVPVYRSNL